MALTIFNMNPSSHLLGVSTLLFFHRTWIFPGWPGSLCLVFVSAEVLRKIWSLKSPFLFFLSKIQVYFSEETPVYSWASNLQGKQVFCFWCFVCLTSWQFWLHLYWKSYPQLLPAWPQQPLECKTNVSHIACTQLMHLGNAHGSSFPLHYNNVFRPLWPEGYEFLCLCEGTSRRRVTNLVSSGLTGYDLLVSSSLYSSSTAYPWNSPSSHISSFDFIKNLD